MQQYDFVRKMKVWETLPQTSELGIVGSNPARRAYEAAALLSSTGLETL